MTVQVYDAVVLAGGAAKRLGGADKPGLRVGGRPLLDRVLSACDDAARTVVVGARRPTARPVRWAYENPPGGGPLAALDAGIRHVTAPVVLALSADLPFLTPDTVGALLAALDGLDDRNAVDRAVLDDREAVEGAAVDERDHGTTVDDRDDRAAVGNREEAAARADGTARPPGPAAGRSRAVRPDGTPGAGGSGGAGAEGTPGGGGSGGAGAEGTPGGAFGERGSGGTSGGSSGERGSGGTPGGASRGAFGDRDPGGAFGDRDPGGTPGGAFGDRDPDGTPGGAFGDRGSGGASGAVRSAAARSGTGRAGGAPGRRGGPARPQGPDGVLLTDAEGRDQPLVAVYRTESLRRELALVATEHGGLAHLPLRLLTADLDLRRLPAEDATASFDCDTWEDLAAARARIRDHGRVLDEWITAVKDELGIELDVDTAALLDLARDAAHGVARPAAPLTTFLAGYAAAQAGGGPEAVAEAARKAAALAARWAEESAEDPGKTTE